jgi:hypothetical protein
MVPSEVFIQHAAECEFMAEFSRDPGEQGDMETHGEKMDPVRCIGPARFIPARSSQDKDA